MIRNKIIILIFLLILSCKFKVGKQENINNFIASDTTFYIELDTIYAYTVRQGDTISIDTIIGEKKYIDKLLNDMFNGN